MTPAKPDSFPPVSPQAAQDALVILVDDDESVREALQALMESVDLPSRAYGSIRAYLDAPVPEVPHVLVLDVRMPGGSGLELQDILNRAETPAPPIIFMSGHADIPMSVRAMKAGAIEFLVKPFRDQDLIDAIHLGIERDRLQRSSLAAKSSIRQRYQTLTQREKEVAALVVTGLLNKQIAGDLGLSEITVKVHRGNAMRKMAAQSLADLVRMFDALDPDGAKG